jgi:hypothetical protein
MSTIVTIFQGGTGANTAADARTNLGVAPSAAYAAANAAANTVRVSANSGSTLSSKQLNFINSATIAVSVTNNPDGNANVAFSATSAGVTLTDDSANTTRYVTFAVSNTGSTSTLNVSSTKLYFNPNTGILSATTFNSLSDENQKENVVTVTNALDTVKQLRGVRFDWKENGKPSLGVIAQELEKVLPELVLNSNGQKTVNYSGIIAVLIEAVKQQQEEIEKLKNGSSTDR